MSLDINTLSVEVLKWINRQPEPLSSLNSICFEIKSLFSCSEEEARRALQALYDREYLQAITAWPSGQIVHILGITGTGYNFLHKKTTAPTLPKISIGSISADSYVAVANEHNGNNNTSLALPMRCIPKLSTFYQS